MSRQHTNQAFSFPKPSNPSLEGNTTPDLPINQYLPEEQRVFEHYVRIILAYPRYKDRKVSLVPLQHPDPHLRGAKSISRVKHTDCKRSTCHKVIFSLSVAN